MSCGIRVAYLSLASRVSQAYIDQRMSQSRHSRRGFNHVGGVCEQMAEFYETWRSNPKASMSLGFQGTTQLFDFLNQEILVTPRRGCQASGEFPTLTITPIEVYAITVKCISCNIY